MKIGFLGLGKMGTPMAMHLITAGHELRVWNRTEGRTKPLLREGAIAAATPAEAELGADAVITMLFDGAARSLWPRRYLDGPTLPKRDAFGLWRPAPAAPGPKPGRCSSQCHAASP